MPVACSLPTVHNGASHPAGEHEGTGADRNASSGEFAPQTPEVTSTSEHSVTSLPESAASSASFLPDEATRASVLLRADLSRHTPRPPPPATRECALLRGRSVDSAPAGSVPRHADRASPSAGCLSLPPVVRCRPLNPFRRARNRVEDAEPRRFDAASLAVIEAQLDAAMDALTQPRLRE